MQIDGSHSPPRTSLVNKDALYLARPSRSLPLLLPPISLSLPSKRRGPNTQPLVARPEALNKGIIVATH